tara:strand:- start:1226 stop:2371 length:1146 start_codon:yes stop_codon:yes gene_type:complete
MKVMALFAGSSRVTYLLASAIILFASCDNLATNTEDDSLSDFLPASEVISNMDAGFNLGNTFDNGYNATDSYENAQLILLYKSAGMKHIRIPVTWMEGFGGDALADEKGEVNFNHPRFLELKKTIDFALQQGLYVIINAHHERHFKEHYDNSAEFDEKFTTLWTDIANYFIEYDQKLVFELLNEPEGAFGQMGGPVLHNDPVAIGYTRKIMRIGTEAVRSTGGNNEKRIIMLGTNSWGNHNQIFSNYPDQASLPGNGSDEYLAIQVHSYDPWEFCGQEGENSAYPGDQETASRMREVAAHGRALGVPLHYGEFGVGRREDQAQRNTILVRDYYRTVVQTAKAEGMASAAWDDRGWFGLTNGDAEQGFSFTYGIVPHMLEKP